VSLGARVSLLALETLDGGIIWPTHGTVISRIITQLGINMVCVCLLFDRVGTQSAVRANEPASFYWHRRLHQLGAAVGCYEIKAFISACERTKLAKRNRPACSLPHFRLGANVAYRCNRYARARARGLRFSAVPVRARVNCRARACAFHSFVMKTSLELTEVV